MSPGSIMDMFQHGLESARPLGQQWRQRGAGGLGLVVPGPVAQGRQVPAAVLLGGDVTLTFDVTLAVGGGDVERDGFDLHLDDWRGAALVDSPLT